MATTVLILVLLGLAVAGVLTFNRLVALRNRADSAWAHIDVQLTRRHDLVPNLVETVRAYAAHERDTLARVVQARNLATTARGPQAQARAEDALTGTLRTLFAVTEAYPDLKANQNFLALQEELVGTEDRIAYARKFFNDSVQALNTTVEKFPYLVLAGAARATRREYFRSDDVARGPVQVRF
jgi:LemA protein